jgi:hypothetical protein
LSILTANGLQDLQANMEGIFVSTPIPSFYVPHPSPGNAQAFCNVWFIDARAALKILRDPRVN